MVGVVVIRVTELSVRRNEASVFPVLKLFLPPAKESTSHICFILPVSPLAGGRRDLEVGLVFWVGAGFWRWFFDVARRQATRGKNFVPGLPSEVKVLLEAP